ncbi:hypothetical protein [Aeromicrobium sp. Leaf350]|uniref:acyltransferase n=1 Tax=Aeromicrobium sp. Leaf350 TaxID=2876565 RepID=UPI001E2E88C7|nr:hypothetical protein [Aeromicrobium sp. Leaf350]
MRLVLAYALLLMPGRVRRAFARRVLGWDIHPTAHLGRSKFIDVGHVSMGPGAVIGPRNTFRGLDEVVLGSHAVIAEANKISGVRSGSAMFPHLTDRRPSLVLGDHAEMMLDHTIDCCDLVELEHHALLAGFQTVILTHSISIVEDTWISRPVRVGHHSIVMSGCTLLNGVVVAPQSAVSAGSVISRDLTEPLGLYHGNPAVKVRDLPADAKLLSREGRFASGEGGAPIVA